MSDLSDEELAELERRIAANENDWWLHADGKCYHAVPRLIAALREARAKPEPIKRREGMVCSLMGLLHNGSRRDAGYQFALDELGRNLKELRDRYLAGDTEVVRDFFSLYVIED